jgi:hypothetical protein
MGADLGYEIKEVYPFRYLLTFFHSKVEGECAIVTGNKNKACPFLCIERPYINISPCIVNLRPQSLVHKNEQEYITENIFIYSSYILHRKYRTPLE